MGLYDQERGEPSLRREDIKRDTDKSDTLRATPFTDEVFDDREERSGRAGGLSVSLMVGVALGAVLVVGVGWYAFKGPGAAELPDGQVQTIAADGTPYKMKPDSPGGMQVDNQDKLVYDRVAKGAAPKRVENLLPPPEEPKEPPRAPQKEVAKAPEPKAPEVKAPEAKAPEPKAAPPAEKTREKTMDALVKEANEAPAKPSSDAAALAAAVAAATGKPVEAPAAKAPETKAPDSKRPLKPKRPKYRPAVTPAAPTPGVAGAFQIQLVSVATEEAAQSEWKRISGKRQDLFAGLMPAVSKADLGEKGIYYRLRAGPLADKAAADSLCAALAADRVGCIVMSRNSLSMTTPQAPLAAVFGMQGLALNEAERGFFKSVRPAGYILFARNIDNPEQATALVDDLRSLNPGFEAFVLIDQEGGRVQRLKPPHWRHAPASGEFEPLFKSSPAKAAEIVRLNIQMIGEELKALGIDVDCAPVADVPVPGAHDVIGDRAFSKDPAVVATLAAAVCDGLRDAGVVPVIKHIPGHGRAMSDSHLELPVVSAGLDELRATDFAPFKQLSTWPGLMFAMTAHVVYTAIDPKLPATMSSKIISEIIRGEIGFKGILISDDLGMKALAGPFDERAAAARAAGCDLMLHCDGNLADMEAVARTAGPLGARGLAALADTPARRPRATIANAAVAQFKVLDALRHV